MLNSLRECQQFSLDALGFHLRIPFPAQPEHVPAIVVGIVLVAVVALWWRHHPQERSLSLSSAETTGRIRNAATAAIMPVRSVPSIGSGVMRTLVLAAILLAVLLVVCLAYKSWIERARTPEA